MNCYKIHKLLTRSIWYNKDLNIFTRVLFLCCYIFELAYRAVVFFRKKLYEYNILKSYKFKIPIIVVGNITVGGTGKTPLVNYIVNYLKSCGFNPAIVSRGYKSKCKTISLARPDSDPTNFGDEPVLLAKSTNCPVVIGKNRVAAINFLIKHHNNINVIVCDDGLQHYALKRDLEIAVVDSGNKFGNNHSLPLGPLRAPIKRLKKVDLIVINGKVQDESENLLLKQLANFNKPIFSFNLVPEKFYNLLEPNNIKTAQDFSEVHAVSGLGNNQRFFTSLKNLCIKVIEHDFPDHYNYQEKDLKFNDDLPIIMTDKDAVKCVKFAKNNFWCQNVSIEFNKATEFNNCLINFLDKLRRECLPT